MAGPGGGTSKSTTPFLSAPLHRLALEATALSTILMTSCSYARTVIGSCIASGNACRLTD